MNDDDLMAYQDDVTVLPPDKSLFKKMGKPNLDQLFSPDILRSAQQVIIDAGGSLMDEAKEELAHLKTISTELEKSPTKASQFLPAIISHAFNTKSRAGLGNYTLVSEISKSLQNYCEWIVPEGLTPKDRSIIKWHVQSMSMLINDRVKGSGGELGNTILAEIRRLAPPP